MLRRCLLHHTVVSHRFAETNAGAYWLEGRQRAEIRNINPSEVYDY